MPYPCQISNSTAQYAVYYKELKKWEHLTIIADFYFDTHEMYLLSESTLPAQHDDEPTYVVFHLTFFYFLFPQPTPHLVFPILWVTHLVNPASTTSCHLHTILTLNQVCHESHKVKLIVPVLNLCWACDSVLGSILVSGCNSKFT